MYTQSPLPRLVIKSTAIFATALLLSSVSLSQVYKFGWRNILTNGQGVSESAAAQAIDRNGNLFVLYNVGSGEQQDCVLRKFTPLGAQVWSVTFEVAPGASRPDTGYALALDSTGNPYASVGAPIDSTVSQACVVRFNGANGAITYRNVFASGAAAFYPRSIAIDTAGSIVQAGGYGANGREKFAIIKRSPAGIVLWSRLYRPATTQADTDGLTLATGTNNDIFVGGYTQTTGGGKDGLVAKFRSSDGAPLWFHVIPGTGFGGDVVRKLLVDPSGDVIAAGETYLSGSNNFAFTRKLRGTNGTKVWQNTVNVPSNNDSSAIGLGRSPTGDILVGGTYWGTNPRPDLFVQKVNPTTGAQIFLTLVNGVADSIDRAAGFAVDRFGNSYIAGSSAPFSGSNKLADFLVARVSLAGALNWKYRYSPGFSSTVDDTAGSLSVDNLTGHVYVAGDAVPTIDTDGKVLAMYQAPVAVADTVNVAKNTLYDSKAPGVMANDVWYLNCTTTVVTPPTNGTFALSVNGRFTYKPPTNFTGTVTFRYRLNRPGLASSEAIVTIKVT